MTIPFIKYSKVWLLISGLTVLCCIFFLAKWGLKPGIDFTGGSLVELTFSQNIPSSEEIKKVFDDQKLNGAVVQKAGDKSFIVRTSFMSEEIHQNLLKNLRAKYQVKGNTVSEDRFETIGSSVSDSLRRRAFWAILFVNLGIIGYVAYSFRHVSRPVESWLYDVVAVVALFHDVLLVMGVFSVLGHYLGIEIDIAFVVA